MTLLDIGDGQPFALHIWWARANLGPFIHYRWSRAWQCHKLNIGRLCFDWRLRRAQRETVHTSTKEKDNG